MVGANALSPTTNAVIRSATEAAFKLPFTLFVVLSSAERKTSIAKSRSRFLSVLLRKTATRGSESHTEARGRYCLFIKQTADQGRSRRDFGVSGKTAKNLKKKGRRLSFAPFFSSEWTSAGFHP